MIDSQRAANVLFIAEVVVCSGIYLSYIILRGVHFFYKHKGGRIVETHLTKDGKRGRAVVPDCI